MEFKSQICTTREQSQRLLALGLKPETADMCYNGYFESHPLEIILSDTIINDEKYIPAWSLSRLLGLLPKCIEQLDEPDTNLEIESFNNCWWVSYIEDETGDIRDCLYSVKGSELFEACISMIKILIKNNYFNIDYLR